jgi:ketosteroid isomerase-like protein
MRNLAIAMSLAVFAAMPSFQAEAGDAETIAAVNQAANALDKAFERQDAKAIYDLTTPDHVAVTPYYGDPQSVEEQIKSLPVLKYMQTNLDEPEVTLLGSDVAMRTFSAELKGTFEGKPIPSPVFITSIMVNRDGKWLEQFYQVTQLAGDRAGKIGPCRALVGTYLTKNSSEGGATGSFTSRSLISFDRGGQAFFNDSGEAGEASYAPFSSGQGVWRCVPQDGSVTARAIVFDFTFPKAGQAPAQIGRLDLLLTYDAKTQGVVGTGLLYLLPLTSEPLKSPPGDGRAFKIEGERVDVPPLD